MTKTRRSFTDEFKREAVKLVKLVEQPGARVTPIARDREGVLDMRANRPIRIEAATEVERLQA